LFALFLGGENVVVLSLFDGIGCGRIALERVGIDVNKYYASEIDTSAIQVAKKNYPDIIEIGDITKVSYENGFLKTEKGVFDVGHIDLVCGGSPCTNFSSIGYANGMTSNAVDILTLDQYMKLKNANATFDGQSALFWEYIRILKEVRPDYYLLENVVMAKKWEKIISKNLFCEPLRINSSLVSAQNRPRLYWTNIPCTKYPEDKDISIDDILEKNSDDTDVSYCLTVQRSMPKLIKKYGYIPEKFNAYNASKIDKKACALSRGSMVTSSCATLLFVNNQNGCHKVKRGILNNKYKTNLQDGRYNIRKLSIVEQERLQTLPKNYTAVSGISRQNRSELIGNCWTVDIISHIFSFLPFTYGECNMDNKNGMISSIKRIEATDEKAINLSADVVRQLHNKIVSSYETQLKPYGVKKLWRDDLANYEDLSDEEFVRHLDGKELQLIFLVKHIKCLVHKDAVSSFVRKYLPGAALDQQVRHLGTQLGWFVLNKSHKIPDTDMTVPSGYNYLVSIDTPNPKVVAIALKRAGRLSARNFEELKMAYGNKCATCGAESGKKDVRDGSIVTLEQGHMNPRKPLTLDNTIPQCKYCNSTYLDYFQFNEYGRVIAVNNPEILLKSPHDIQDEMIQILLKERQKRE